MVNKIFCFVFSNCLGTNIINKLSRFNQFRNVVNPSSEKYYFCVKHPKFQNSSISSSYLVTSS